MTKLRGKKLGWLAPILWLAGVAALSVLVSRCSPSSDSSGSEFSSEFHRNRH